MRIVAIVLIVLGTLILVYQGFTYIKRETVVDAGPVQVSVDRKETVWVPPVVGGIAVATGLVLLATSRRVEA